MKSVLIIGSYSDTFCTSLKKYASGKKINAVLLKPDDFFDNMNIELCLNSNGNKSKLKSGKKKIDLNDFTAVFPRITNLIRSSYPDSGKDSFYKASEWNSFYKGWLHSLNVPVINLLSPQYWNRQILSPLDLFPYSGKIDPVIPGFITSNMIEELKNFHSACGKKTLYYPQTQTSSYYQIDTDEKLVKLFSLLEFMYVTLYEVPEGNSYKIFVANGEAFAVNTNGNQSKFVPPKILNDCIFLTDKFNLSFAEFVIIYNGNKFYLMFVKFIPDFSGCNEKVKMKIISEIFKGIATEL